MATDLAVKKVKEGLNGRSAKKLEDGARARRGYTYLLNKSWIRVDKFHQHFILHEYH